MPACFEIRLGVPVGVITSKVFEVEDCVEVEDTIEIKIFMVHSVQSS